MTIWSSKEEDLKPDDKATKAAGGAQGISGDPAAGMPPMAQAAKSVDGMDGLGQGNANPQGVSRPMAMSKCPACGKCLKCGQSVE